MFQGISKRREPRKFNYKARYYDRESAEIRKQKIIDGEENTTVDFKDRFSRKVNESRRTKYNSYTKIFVMLAILILLLYIVLS